MRRWMHIALVFLPGLLAMPVSAQDALFSLPGNLPLAINPAHAGAFHDRWVALSHRDRRVPGGEPFRTTAFSADMCLNPVTRDRPAQHGRYGLGLHVATDRAGVPALRTTDAQASLAYQLFMDDYSSVGAGIQAGFRNVLVDPLRGSWASQYDGMRHDPAAPHGESAEAWSRTRPDVGAGMYYSYRRMPRPRRHTSDLELRTGLAVHHAARPDISLLMNGRDRLYRRWSAYVQGWITPGGGRLALEPVAWFFMQGPSHQLLAGLNLRLDLHERGFLTEREASVAVGLLVRNAHSAVATVEARWEHYGIGLGYDMGLLRMVPGAAPHNALEFSLRYLVPAAQGVRRR